MAKSKTIQVDYLARVEGDDLIEAEKRSDLEAANERLANRPTNPNLRGGIGSNQIRFDRE